VLPASTAWGTSFRISSNQCKAFLKNGAFYDIDRGTEPDYVFPTLEQYYDRADLTDYINDLCRIENPQGINKTGRPSDCKARVPGFNYKHSGC